MSFEAASAYRFKRGPYQGRRVDSLPLLRLAEHYGALLRQPVLEWDALQEEKALEAYLSADGVFEQLAWAAAHGREPCACCA